MFIFEKCIRNIEKLLKLIKIFASFKIQYYKNGTLLLTKSIIQEDKKHIFVKL